MPRKPTHAEPKQRLAGCGRTVSARSGRAEKLAQSEAQLRTLMDAPIGFAFLDRDLRYQLINKQLAEINGLPISAHIGKSVGDIVPSLLPMARKVTGRILSTGRPIKNREFSGETPRVPGVVRCWNESWYPVRDRAGAIIGFGAVVEDVTARKRAEDALRKANDELESKVKQRTAELRSLACRLIHAEEAERKRIIDILHDDLQQLLVALGYEIETLRKGNGATAARVAASDASVATLNKAIRITRSLCAELGPPALDSLGLAEGLQLLACDMQSRFGLKVRFCLSPAAEPPRAELRTVIAESVRELLFNVVKHAGVKTARVKTEIDGEWIEITVTDRGGGCGRVRDAAKGIGLAKIRERASWFGGEFRIVSSPGKGTSASLRLPFHV